MLAHSPARRRFRLRLWSQGRGHRAGGTMEKGAARPGSAPSAVAGGRWAATAPTTSDAVGGHGAAADTRTPTGEPRARAAAAQGRPVPPCSCCARLGRLPHWEEGSKLCSKRHLKCSGSPSVAHGEGLPISREPAGQGERCGRSPVTPLASQGQVSPCRGAPASRPRWPHVLRLWDGPPPRALTVLEKKF